MRFLNTKKQMHQDSNYMNTLCEPSEAFSLTGRAPILPVSPPQDVGSFLPVPCLLQQNCEMPPLKGTTS